jgi:Protein of unknown function (DUF3303)
LVHVTGLGWVPVAAIDASAAKVLNRLKAKEASMKVMVEWSTRSASTYEEAIANEEALIRAFAKWSVPDGLTIHVFVAKVEGPAGYILMEGDDAAVMAKFAAQFMAWNDAKLVPVIDVQEGASIYGEGVAWAKSAAG